jgi:hypothetical protein
VGHRPFLYLCPGCAKSKRNQSCEYVCLKCGDDLKKLALLYSRIVCKHKSLKKAGMGEVMTRLWEWYEKQQPGYVPPKEPANDDQSASLEVF